MRMRQCVRVLKLNTTGMKCHHVANEISLIPMPIGGGVRKEKENVLKVSVWQKFISEMSLSGNKRRGRQDGDDRQPCSPKRQHVCPPSRKRTLPKLVEEDRDAKKPRIGEVEE